MRTVVVMLSMLVATPAMADWQIKAETEKKSWSYTAFDSNKSGDIEMQFYCDHEYPGEIQLLVFTSEDWTAGPDAQNEVALTLTIDDKPFAPLAAHDDEVNSERVVYGDTLDDKALFDVVEAAKTATSSIVASYENVSYRFPAAGIEPVLTEFTTGCAG